MGLSSAVLTPPCPRMRGVVNLGQVLKVQMGVDLGGPDVGMAEQLLDAAQVAAGFQQMRGEGMPEHMRMHAQPDSHAPRQVPTRNWMARGVRRRPLRPTKTAASSFRGRLARSASHLRRASTAKRPIGRIRVLLPLAQDPYGAILQIDGGQIEPDEFPQAQAR